MKKLFLSLVAILSIALFSCNKEETTLFTNEDEAIVSNDAAAEAVVESLDSEVDLFTSSTESINLVGGTLKSASDFPFWARYVLGQVPDITIENTEGGFPVTVTIDYGDGVELLNGTVISGKIVIVISAPPRTDGAIRTVTFDNFYIDSVNIAGTRTITFNLGEGGGFEYQNVGSLVITFSDGSYIERETEKTRTFVEGYDTPGDWSDDIFEITGFTNSVSSEGYTFSATITEPLIRIGTCRYIVQGVVTMSKNDELFAELNYGDGTCDDIAIITKDGEEIQITIGRRHLIRSF